VVAAAVAARAAQGVDFAHEVVPILRKHCGECHTGDARQGGFSLNTREDLLAGGHDSQGPERERECPFDCADGSGQG
jgi:mono/diheme cytochrome c family protein